MSILNDIVSTYKISQSQYAHHSANLWVKYDFTESVNKAVLMSFLKNKHLMVILWYYMIKCKILVKKVMKKCLYLSLGTSLLASLIFFLIFYFQNHHLRFTYTL